MVVSTLKYLTRVFPMSHSVWFKWGFNLFPAFRRTGARVVLVSNDLMHVRVKVPLNWKTKNYWGTMYGGTSMSVTDAIYAVQIIQKLGEKDYVVWDKATEVYFKRPGTTTLSADFLLTASHIDCIRKQVAKKGEMDFKIAVSLVDTQQKTCVEVVKTIYIAKKSFYKQKREAREEQPA